MFIDSSIPEEIFFKKMYFWMHDNLISAQKDQERYTLKAFMRGRRN